METACRGVIKHVADRQTDHGVKDAFTQHWIDYILKRYQILREAAPQRLKEDIEKELLIWVRENEATIYNPFLTYKGKFLSINRA